MGDQADLNLPVENKNEPTVDKKVSAEGQQPKTSERILSIALANKTEKFLSHHLFDSLDGTRRAMYACAVPVGLDAVVSGSPDDFKRAMIYFGTSAGFGLLDAAKQWSRKKSASHNKVEETNLAGAK